MQKINKSIRMKHLQSNRRPTEMFCDEDSRDSGICDMDYATMSTTFHESIMHNENMLPPLEYDKFDLVKMEESEENSLCEELMQLVNETSTTEVRTLQNITVSVNNRTNNSYCSFRKTSTTTTCSSMKLFDESPKSRALFVRPTGLKIRSANQLNRKRQFNDSTHPQKKQRRETKNRMENEEDDDDDEDDEEDVDVQRPSTSAELESRKPFQVLSMNRKFGTSQNTGSSLIHRAQSSSILERGASYTKNHSNDNELPQLLEVNYHLKTISPVCSNAFRRITSSTLYDLMKCQSEEEFVSKYVLIDCRYPYEFNGGHIKTAINVYDPAHCESIFYDENGTKKETRIPIFYCEYSQKRGPSMAYSLRRFDRQRNELRYPHCDYQEMYVLDKGFRNFYSFTQERNLMKACEPNGYVPMDKPEFASELKKWSFHKKMVNASAVRGGSGVGVGESRNRLFLRQFSSESHFSFSSANISRRPLFGNKSPSEFSLTTVPELRTPSPRFIKPLSQPNFS